MIRDWLKRFARRAVSAPEEPVLPSRRRLLTALGVGAVGATTAPSAARGYEAPPPPPARRGVLGLGSTVLYAGARYPMTEDEFTPRVVYAPVYQDTSGNVVDDVRGAFEEARRANALSVEVPCPGTIGALLASSSDPASILICRLSIAGEELVFGQPIPIPGGGAQPVRAGEFVPVERPSDYTFNRRVRKGDLILVGFQNADRASAQLVSVGFTFDVEE